jgi:hypothetical protein
VFETAATRFGRAHEPACVHALMASGVEWAPQLKHLSDEDWERAGVSLGLKTAVKAELSDPSASTSPMVDERCTVDQQMQQFLLLPTQDGTEAKSLSSPAALFLSLVATPVAERQTLLLALCELTAVVSGLFLPLPLEFRRQHSTADPATNWDTPTMADGMDAFAILLFLVDVWVTFFAVMSGLLIASGGWHLDDHFCRGAIGIISKLLMYFFMQALVWPLMALTLWHGFMDATSPWPLIGCVATFFLFYMSFMTILMGFIIEHMPLEMYHMPKWLREDLKMSMPWLRSRLADKSLRGPAERRAAKLRAQMGL